MVDLGDEVEVRVDDIDPQGKVSLSLGDAPAPATAPAPHRRRSPRHAPLPEAARDGCAACRRCASFEDSWESEAEATFGDLGPADTGCAGPAAGTAARAATPAVAVKPGWAEPHPDRQPPAPPAGLTVVTETMTDVRSVSLGFWVGIGSVDEAPASAGASHFLEHLLFKGTPTRSARQIAEAVDAVGGDMNAFTTKEYTAFYLRLLADDVELGPRHPLRHHVVAGVPARTRSRPSAR